MRKIGIVAASMLAALSVTTTALACVDYTDIRNYTTSATHVLNNEIDLLDTKWSMSQQDSRVSAVVSSVNAQKDETSVFKITDPAQDLSAVSECEDEYLAKAKAYLIQHGIMERKVGLEYTNSGFVAIPYESKISSEVGQFESVLSSLGSLNTACTQQEALDYWEKCRSATVSTVAQLKKYGNTSISDSRITELNKKIDSYNKKAKKAIKAASKGKIHSTTMSYVRKLTTLVSPYSVDLLVVDEDNMSKSDFLVSLYKSVYGPIESSVLKFHNYSLRSSNKAGGTDRYYRGNSSVQSGSAYWHYNTWTICDPAYDEEGKATGGCSDTCFGLEQYNANFIGDSYLYSTTNVYELYLKKMKDSGFLTGIAFNSEPGSAGARFIQDYNNYGTVRPSWTVSDSIVNASSSGKLGYSISYSNTSLGQAELGFIEPNYFADETMTTIEALELVERFLRSTEKEITDTEASIVAYKYGVDYLQNLTTDQQATVSFLVAKGIINFEDDLNSLNLYGIISRGEAIKILYRIANPEARYDFSVIQLTDGETFWMNKGYSAKTFAVYTMTEMPVIQDVFVSEEEEEDSIISPSISRSIRSRLGWDSALAASNNIKVYNVVKQFSQGTQVFYNGVDISTLINNTTACPDVSSVASESIIYNGTSTPVYTVTFRVKNTAPELALAYVNKNITIDPGTRSAMIQTVTRVTTGSGDNTVSHTLIPQSALAETFSDISIVADKVLYNKKTGTQAILLPNEGIALVGNTVYRSNNLMVMDAYDEVYYNLEFIVGLLSNAYLKDVGLDGTGSIFITDGVAEHYVDVTSSTGTVVNTLRYYRTQLNASCVINAGDGDYYQDGDVVTLYNIDSASKCINTLHRAFDISYTNDEDEVVTGKAHVIVDFQYVVPTAEDLSTDHWSQMKTFDMQLTLQSATELMHTRPTEDSTLQLWWDSNYTMTNSLANFIYGTSKVKYFDSGYITPCLTVLLPGDVKSGTSDSVVNSIFKDNGFALLTTVDGDESRFINGTDTNYFWKSYFNGQRGMGEQEYLLQLAKKRRVYKEFTMSKQLTNLDVFGDYEFVLTKAGVLYRDITKDIRFEPKLDGNGIITEVRVPTRTAEKVVPSIGAEVIWQGNKWIYRGTTADGYFILQPNYDFGLNNWCGQPARWSTMSDRINSNTTYEQIQLLAQNAKDFWYVDTQDVNQLFAGMSSMYTGTFAYSTYPVYSDIQDIFGVTKEMSSVLQDGVLYLSNGGIARCVVSPTGAMSLEQLTNQELTSMVSGIGPQPVVYAIPKFYLGTGSFYFYKDKNNGNQLTLGKGVYVPSLTMGSAFYAGLNDSVINNIIADEVGVMTVANLSDGQKLYIGDTVWTKMGDRFVSDLITDSSLVSACKSDGAASTATHLLGGMSVSYGIRKVNLTAYLSDYAVGPFQNVDKLLYNDNGRLHVWSDNEAKPITELATAVTLTMKIDDSLQVRPLDDKYETFIVVLRSTSAGGEVEDFPFYHENLNYEESGVDVTVAGVSKFSPTQYFKAAKDAFMLMYREALAGDIVNLALVLVIVVCCYLTVASWLCIGLYHNQVCHSILEALALKNGNATGSKGVDLLRIVSLGFYSLNTPPTFARSFVVCFLSVVIIHIALGLL